MKPTLEMRLLYWLISHKKTGRKTFTGRQIETAGPTHLGSTWMRTLRDLRKKDLLDYKCIDRAKSEYELLTPLNEMINTYNVLMKART